MVVNQRNSDHRGLKPIAMDGAIALARLLATGLLATGLTLPPASAQQSPRPPLPRDRQLVPPSIQPPAPPQIEPPPSIDDLQLPPSPTLPQQELPPGSSQTVWVKQFQIEGSRVFTQAEIDAVTKDFLNQELTFAQLIQAADAITQLYLSQGYITTGAYIPADRPMRDGIVPVQVIEGGVKSEDIRVRFVRRVVKDGQVEFQEVNRSRLQAAYIRSRIGLATGKPLNREKLLEALQLLKQNPLIQDLRVTLAAGTRPGQSILEVQVVEAQYLGAQLLLDNGRSPTVGTFRQQLQLRDLNLTGLGDSLYLIYTHSDGSHTGDLSYTLPVNPYNGTLSINFGLGTTKVTEEPFDVLDIRSRSNYVEMTFRQPIIQSPTRELALGLTASRQFSRATLIDGEIPFPSRGSDFLGNTNVNALRFFQEWIQRSAQDVFAVRSQFSAGLGVFDATKNEEPPDGRFFAWRGQAQWVKLLAPDTTLLLRGDLQLADRALAPIEQFGLGGPFNVRGYRQDAILSDNGFFASAEVRIPVLRIPQWEALLQVAPFVDVGTTWNLSGFENPEPRTLASIGVGLRYQMGSNLTARFDWGQRLVAYPGDRNSLQEKGLYFSLIYNTPF